ncbi:MAG: T9SS type A sorting domain-containing protein [Saprospiraceae bacterium]|nr:T9SS type A sorting domain-containing protein [Saprospiraceae bacterium]
MMRFSHAIIRLTAFVMFILGGYSTMNAQFVLTVNGNDYPATPAGFGVTACTSTTGEWVIADDGTAPTSDACTPILNNLTGKIALIDRGSCSFDIKCLAGQTAGAVAVIVCNNAVGPAIAMGVATPATADQITIPCFMITKQDCDVIRLLTPITVTVEGISPEYPDGDVVVWGENPGEGDFGGGLNSWEVNNIACGNGTQEFELWRWTADGSVLGAYGNGLISSPTSCNGAMGFASDFYDNGGVTAPGTGPCTANQEGELISPLIDLSTTSAAGVSLQFFQASRQFQSEYFVGYSTDNGNTWTEIAINTELVTNDPITQNIVRVALPGVVGSSQVRFKFRYLANYYFWIIDDVRLVEQEANNVQVNENFYAVAQNAATPLALVEPIHFLADISNLGAATQTDVNLNMTILKSDNSVVFDEDLSYGSVNGNSIVENVPFTASYTPDAIDAYLATYSISSDQVDFDTTNNELSFEFTVTDSIWAKELGQTRLIVPAGSNWEAGEAHTWTYGNHFATPDLGSNQVFATSVSFSIDNSQNAGAATGQVPQITLYEWVDANNDGNVQDAERFGITFASYIVTGTETANDIITVPLNDITPLVSNTHYLVMLEYTAPDAVTDLWLAASDAVDYNAMIFLNGPDVLARPRFASMLAIGELSTAEYSSNGFGTDLVPVVRLNTGIIVGTKDPLNDNNRVDVYPNPVQDILNLDYDLEQTAANLSIRVMDITGKVVMERQYSQVKKDKIELNVKALAAGTYNVQLITENGTTSRRFVVAK